MIILHGLLGHGAEWAAIAAKLGAKAPDLLGHGAAPPLGPGPVWPQYRALIDALMEGEGRPVPLAGHSMGGTLALRYAAERPEHVSRLILIEAGLRPASPQSVEALTHWIVHGWPERFESRAEAAQFFEETSLHPAWIDTLDAALAPRFDRASCARLIGEMEGEGRQSALRAIRCPIHLVLAEESLLEEGDIREMGAHPALHPAQIIAGAGHDLHLDQPERTARALARALSPLRLREERPGDENEIDALTRAAFAPMPYSDGSEPGIIRDLRAAGALSLSLVARIEGELVGHVAFSPLRIGQSDAPWCALGPISVRADQQRQGIGGALVAKGLAMMRARGMQGCALIGSPKVYGPMGFTSCGKLSYQGLDPALVQHIRFAGPPAEGELQYHAAFGA